MKSARIHPFARMMAEHCRRLSELGFSPGTTGQVSALDDDMFWVTPAGANFCNLQAEHLVPVWPDGQLEEPESQAPHSAFELHRGLYKAHPTLGAMVLARPPQACVWAATQLSGTAQPKVASLPGFAASFLILDAASFTGNGNAPEDWPIPDTTLIAMADTGLLSVGTSLSEAINQLETLESYAAVELRSARFRSIAQPE